MKVVPPALWFLLVVLLGLLPACDSPVAPATPTPVAPLATLTSPPLSSPVVPLAGHLLDAFGLVPTSTATLEFTDWALLAAYDGVLTPTATSRLDAQRQVFTAIFQNQYPVSLHGMTYVGAHADAWSWDFTNLTWEATIHNINTQNPDLKPAVVYKLRDNFDVAPVLAHFTQYGFLQRTYAGVPIFSHAQVPGAPWFDTNDLNVLNTAVLADQKLLVESQSLEVLKGVLDAYQQTAARWADLPTLTAVAARLEPAAGALISLAYPACDYSGVPANLASLLKNKQLNPPDPVPYETLVPEQAAARQYAILGAAYHYEAGHVVSPVVLQYPTADAAAADLALRQALATNGVSLGAGQNSGARYTDKFFTLDSAHVEGTDLLLQLHPLNDQPQNVLSLAVAHDFLLALCPSR